MQESRHGPTKSSLSSTRSRLVELMQRVNFGRIEDLRVRAGAPTFDPPPRVVREVKFGGENGPHPKLGTEDFQLKAEVRELFARLEEMGDGTVISLEIKHGLPFRMHIEEVTA